MKIRKITTALAFACVVAVPAAHAQQQSDAQAKAVANVDVWFERCDKNHDGNVTPAEFELGKQLFVVLDLDANGSLTRDEAKNALTKKSKHGNVDFVKMDTDGDGYVTVREWTGTPEEFDANDLDHDRVISSYDRDLARARNRAENRLKAYDTDKDGFVSQTEWPADVSTFRKQDRNRDGKLSVDELQEDVKRRAQ